MQLSYSDNKNGRTEAVKVLFYTESGNSATEAVIRIGRAEKRRNEKISKFENQQ